MSFNRKAVAQVQAGDRNINQLQSNINAALGTILSNPLAIGQVLKDIQLVSGTNSINHGLGRELQGWVVVRQGAPATFYDTQATNTTPTLTLALVSSASVKVSLYVF